MSSAEQLYLLADHIKLSLLERQRAQSLGLDNDSQDGHLSRSLEQLKSGLASLEMEKTRLRDSGDDSAASALSDSISSLQEQLDHLTSQFHGFVSPQTIETVTHPNSEALADDFQHATSTPSAYRKSKSVRFSDTPSSPSEELFGRYRDDPANNPAAYRDQADEMSNQQIHEYHSQIMEQQDEQLDRLGESINRQRELSMQIGDELDSHVVMLDEVDGVVDRHQSRLDRGQRMLSNIARGAGENKQMTAIVVLIIILVLLIAILK
ncbi:SNARE complex subunit (Syn8) [Cordyceps fumosorosea ARSEF 2679]|uniref:SNARE complex subunit (Syn8) n=1 Tax=Cordyceps fumosorosea (strain ARSEF 2679) TaxID=1081104 RepID=A0A167RRH3_CORFA|nr:SNARE complex subunit (Syn8) [Cordyceps fumosorosea ARSEF 2679]OAA58859.1 SNARE complex subunit (Syn8) [Cordyceps fumosorosea ARSEF 2679]